MGKKYSQHTIADMFRFLEKGELILYKRSTLTDNWGCSKCGKWYGTDNNTQTDYYYMAEKDDNCLCLCPHCANTYYPHLVKAAEVWELYHDKTFR